MNVIVTNSNYCKALTTSGKPLKKLSEKEFNTIKRMQILPIIFFKKSNDKIERN